MRGAPWDGRFYGFVVAVIVFTGALVMAMGSQDFLARTVSWTLVALSAAAGVRIIRAALRTDETEHPTGRWWFGG